MTRPASATDFANDRLGRSRLNARCPQIIDGTAVKPNVRSAKTPRVKAQIGRADNSSSERTRVGEVMFGPASSMSGRDGLGRKSCGEKMTRILRNGLLVGSSFDLIQRFR